MDKGTFYDLLDKYMNSGLSESEIVQFNMLMEQDNTLKEEFEFQKEVKSAVVINERQKKIKELDAVRSQYRDSKENHSPHAETKTVSIFRKYALYAAAALVLIIPSIFLLQQNANVEYQSIYSQSTEVSIKPKAGKLGAAPSKVYYVEILCCTEYERAELDGDNMKLYLSDAIAITDLSFEIEGEFVVVKRGGAIVKKIGL